jgi:hypothetical protein
MQNISAQSSGNKSSLNIWAYHVPESPVPQVDKLILEQHQAQELWYSNSWSIVNKCSRHYCDREASICRWSLQQTAFNKSRHVPWNKPVAISRFPWNRTHLFKCSQSNHNLAVNMWCVVKEISHSKKLYTEWNGLLLFSPVPFARAGSIFEMMETTWVS